AREEFIYNAVREKIARESGGSAPNPLDKLENATAQVDALMFLLIEYINSSNADAIGLHVQTRIGLVHLKKSADAALEEAYAAAQQGIAEMKGGAR
ncbi:MAG TPA: hypothetical protein VK846_11385, partial [Candidatus Limnocylindria bacterium]|nr:hypothetical protein [Candidatus Limnocylindria bacterium]